MKKYITYEEPLQGKIFTEKQMYEVYRDMADKTEYPSYTCWFIKCQDRMYKKYYIKMYS